MASRSAKLAGAPSRFRGCRPTGAKRTWSRSKTSAAAAAIAVWPWCGGSKLPPKRATRMAILSRTAPATLRKVEDETHADLFDGVVVAIRSERIQTAVAELGYPPVHDREQFDNETGQPLALEG